MLISRAQKYLRRRPEARPSAAGHDSCAARALSPDLADGGRTRPGNRSARRLVMAGVVTAVTVGGALASSPAASAGSVSGFGSGQQKPSASGQQWAPRWSGQQKPSASGQQWGSTAVGERIQVGAEPVASFVRSPGGTTINVGTPVTFDASATTGDDLNWQWSINGSTRAGGKNYTKFEYTFIDPGWYEVEQLVTDSSGRTSSQSDTFMVIDPAAKPEARFTQTPTSPTVAAGTEVTFDGTQSLGDQLTYYWFVRGERGVVSFDPVLNYTFKRPGSYGIQLVVVDSSNRVASQWTGLQVVTATAPPVAQIARTPSTPTVAAGTKVTFDGGASSGEGLRYAWYVRGEAGVFSTDPAIEYTFQYPGEYGIQLVITDNTGRQAQQWIPLSVTGANRAPIATFTQTPNRAVIFDGEEVTFDASRSYDPDGDQISYYWYVRGEPGVVSTDPVFKHRFPGAGDYGVQLVVVDTSNARAKKWVSVSVEYT